MQMLTEPSSAPADVAALGTILSVWAHPDDETYLAGALMAAAADRGQRVVCASATAGERGTGDPGRWPPERLGPVRRLEAAAAMAVLGVDEHRMLGLPDGALADHEAEGVAMVAELIDDVRPDAILTFGPTGMTFHPDHLAVHRWVRTAWQAAGCPGRLLEAVWSVDHLRRFGHLLEANGTFMGDLRPVGVPAERLALHLRPQGGALDRKVTALRAMATQTAAAIAAAGEDRYAEEVAEECFVEVEVGADVAAAAQPSGLGSRSVRSGRSASQWPAGAVAQS